MYSLTATLTPNRLPTARDSSAGTPSSHAKGASKLPRMPSKLRALIDPIEQGIDDREQSQEGDQHRNDVQGELHTIARPGGRRIDEIGVLGLWLNYITAESLWLLRFGEDQLRKAEADGC